MNKNLKTSVYIAIFLIQCLVLNFWLDFWLDHILEFVPNIMNVNCHISMMEGI